MDIIPCLAAQEEGLSAISKRAISSDTASFFQIENRRKHIKVYNKVKSKWATSAEVSEINEHCRARWKCVDD